MNRKLFYEERHLKILFILGVTVALAGLVPIIFLEEKNYILSGIVFGIGLYMTSDVIRHYKLYKDSEKMKHKLIEENYERVILISQMAYSTTLLIVRGVLALGTLFFAISGAELIALACAVLIIFINILVKCFTDYYKRRI